MDPTLYTAALIGMATGDPAASHAVLENANNNVCGTVMELPAPFTDQDRLLCESWGIVWLDDKGEPTTAPPYVSHGAHRLTFPCRAPAGWKVKPTDHYLYKSLEDDQGRSRAQLMIHHQERDAWFYAEARFRATYWSANYRQSELKYPCVKDSSGNPLWVGNPRTNVIAAERRAQEILTAVAGKERVYDFDAPYEFPPSETELPELKAYTLSTTFYRVDGSSADSGSSTIHAADDAKAIELAKLDKMSCYLIHDILRDSDGKTIWESDGRKLHRHLGESDGYSITRTGRIRKP